MHTRTRHRVILRVASQGKLVFHSHQVPLKFHLIYRHYGSTGEIINIFPESRKISPNNQ